MLLQYQLINLCFILFSWIALINAATSEKETDGLVTKSSRAIAINQLNMYKCMHGQDVTDFYKYDTCIEKFTQGWADTEAQNNTMDHSMVSYEQFQCGSPNGYGENVGSGQRNISVLLADFYSEVSLYDWSKPTYQPSAGHFSAMIWKNATLFAMGGKKSTTTMYPYWSTVYGSPAGPAPNTIGGTYFADNVTPLTKTWEECHPIVTQYEKTLKNSASTVFGQQVVIGLIFVMVLEAMLL